MLWLYKSQENNNVPFFRVLTNNCKVTFHWQLCESSAYHSLSDTAKAAGKRASEPRQPPEGVGGRIKCCG